MLKTSIALIGLVGIIICMSGCAGAPSRSEAHYGESFRQAKYNQILDPGACKNLEPQEGLDGQAAGKVMDTYRKTFEEKEEARPIIAIIE
ncbi:MAG: hypothetical protein ACNYWU_08005 [Desulfobacterales bacterium]